MKKLEKIYEELLDTENSKLINIWQEAVTKRKKANRISITICSIIDIIVLIILIICFPNNKSIIEIMPIFVQIITINILILVATRPLYYKELMKFNSEYKKIVINKLMNNFYSNLEYYPKKEIPEYIYKKAYYKDYDIYKSEDYMEAQIDNKYSIQMGEVLTQKKEEYEDLNGEKQTRIITLFHGLFAKIELDKSIDSYLKIAPNGTIMSKYRLNMDSSEFEKFFDVMASNKIIGMQILTADVMEELVNFITKTKMKYDVILDNNDLYIRFYSGSMFEATNLKDEPLDKPTMERYFYMLNFTYNLSKKLINIVNNTEI